MLAKRIIPCLYVTGGRVVTGVHFVNLCYGGDPVELADRYNRDGADELVFLDITASSDAREIMADVVARTARKVFIPLAVGGGIRSVGDARRIRVGASDVSLARSAPAESSILNSLPARVLGHVLDDRNQVNVSIGLGRDGAGDKLLARITRKSWDALQLQAGSEIYAQIKGVALI